MYRCIMSIGIYQVGDLLTEEEFNNLSSFEERVCFKLTNRATQLERIAQLSQKVKQYDKDDYDSSEETQDWTALDGREYVKNYKYGN